MTDTSKRPVHLGIIAAGIGLSVVGLGALLARAAQATVMVPAVLAAAVVTVLSLLAAARAAFARREAVERDQVAEFRRTHASTELFEDADDAARLAARSHEHFLKYGVPFFTILLGLALVTVTVLLWRAWSSQPAFPVARNPLSMAALSVILGLFPAICGSYFIGVSREAGCRWLRPAGGWMFLVGGLFGLGAAVMLCEHFGRWTLVVDYRAAQASVVLLGALGVELVLSFVIEFYRPRMPGEGERPLPESRILSLFTEPGGVARNVAASLDYQFGFQVSEVWFYRFLERTVVPFAVAMVLLLWLLTSLVTIEPYDCGIRETLGRVERGEDGRAEILTPGFYLKWPWPLSRILIFPVEQVQEVVIGYDESEDRGTGEAAPADDGHGHGETRKPADPAGPHKAQVIVWSTQHYASEVDFLVGSDPRAGGTAGDVGQVTASLMAADIPLYFRVEDLYSYAYLHQDAREELRSLATREVVRYLAEADFNRLLGSERAQAAVTLQERIQAAADRVQLGIRVVFVGLQGLHPPVETGASFDAVVGASEEMHQRVLEAEGYAARRRPEAEGRRAALVNEAEAYRTERRQVAEAEAEQFTKQLLAYRASPRMFVLNSFLDILENDAAAIRKYVVATERSREVFILDLQEKLRPDLLDLDTSAVGQP